MVVSDLDDEEHHEADLARVKEACGGEPFLEYAKPNGSGRAHLYYPAGGRPGNDGPFYLGGTRRIGDLIGRTLKGTIGCGVRMYEGELDALQAAVEGQEYGNPVDRKKLDALRAKPPRAAAKDTGRRAGAKEVGGNGAATLEQVVAGIDALAPGAGLHHNAAFCGGVQKLVLARILTDESYDGLAPAIEAALERAERRGVSQNPRTAGFAKVDVRDAYESAKREWKAARAEAEASAEQTRTRVRDGRPAGRKTRKE